MTRYSRPIKSYYTKLNEYAQRKVVTELSIRPAFFNLLDETKPSGWLVEGESAIRVGSRMIRPDAVIKDRYLIRGYYEAKDRSDNLHTEIEKKRRQGYPLKNIVFENSEYGILVQGGDVTQEIKLREPTHLERLLGDFFGYEEPNIEQFQSAVKRFRQDIPELSASLKMMIHEAKLDTHVFRTAFASFLAQCRQSIDPRLGENTVEEMLVQHLLTERLMRSIFEMDRFNQDNPIAREIDQVITALSGRGFSRIEFEHRLDYFYKAIELAAEDLPDFSEKQRFINGVYEDFFQGYAADIADTHGIVYTPQEIVKFMCAAVEQVLSEEFHLRLSDPSVNILDPCTGTGNFIVNLMRRAHASDPLALKRMYERQLFANEVMLLPYYVASLNIEHEYYDLTKNWLPFDGLSFVDTLDLAERKGQPALGLFAEENTERVAREKATPVTVIIGNPPYNVGQRSENDNNKNRVYPIIDREIRNTYAKDSAATLKMQLYDPYVKFFRWATDRLEGRDGVVCFVSNNSFVEQIAFDGMRKHLLQDFTRIYHIDLHGNVRQNPKLSGTTHNVFGIQVGVGITVAVRSAKHIDRRVYYTRVPEFWHRGEKLAWLARLIEDEGKDKGGYTEFPLHRIVWEELMPDSRNTWLVPENADEYLEFVPIGSKATKASKAADVESIFKTYSGGVKTNRDDTVYDFSDAVLASRMEQFVEHYNSEVDRYKRSAPRPANIDAFVNYDLLKWDGSLKDHLKSIRYAQYDVLHIRQSSYRPFDKEFLYFDHLLINRTYLQRLFLPSATMEIENPQICVSGLGSLKPFQTLVVNNIPCLDILEKTQCFPLYVYAEDGSNRRDNVTDWSLSLFQKRYHDAAITKEDIFYYVYGLLQHPEYRTRYADNLKRELPRLPTAPNFYAFSQAGRELARLHLDYEQIMPYSLEMIYSANAREPEVWRVAGKMRLDKSAGTIKVNEMLTLAGVPPEVHEYRLGNRSALEWVIEQYRVKDGSDPNRYSDDPRYIVNLLGSIVRVSMETVQIVNELAKLPII